MIFPMIPVFKIPRSAEADELRAAYMRLLGALCRTGWAFVTCLMTVVRLVALGPFIAVAVFISAVSRGFFKKPKL